MADVVPNSEVDLDPSNQEPPSTAKTGEDRKAAAALSSLDDRAETAVSSSSKKIDAGALGDAMKRLDMKSADGESDSVPKARTQVQIDAAAARARRAEEDKKLRAVKVDAADVAMLADQLDMSKTKATDLLKRHNADAVKAMTAWVTSTV